MVYSAILSFSVSSLSDVEFDPKTLGFTFRSSPADLVQRLSSTIDVYKRNDIETHELGPDL